MTQFTFHIEDSLIDENTQRFNLKVNHGEHWYLHLKSWSNISGLFDWLSGRRNFAFGKIWIEVDGERYDGHFQSMKYASLVRFKYIENESSKFYYQQRYHSSENEGITSLREYLGNIDNQTELLCSEFGLTSLLDESINMLSTGEFKKACIVKAYQSKPLILFIEEPYTGIDSDGRKKVDALLHELTIAGTSLVIASSGRRIPGFINRVYNFEELEINSKEDRRLFDNTDENGYKALKIKMPEQRSDGISNAFELRNVTIRYGERIILNNISWKVRKNEKWALTGVNGSGKSTLLSMVYADNPQVYSNEVYVFDKQRGTGESIWEIKERIGFYSSELHRYFDKSKTIAEAIQSLANGNPYKKIDQSAEVKNFVAETLKLFELEMKLDKPLFELSNVQQKLVLMIGAMAKNPLLLILDEPFQGFDELLIKKCKFLIDEFCKNRALVFVSHVMEEIPGCIENKFEL
jgi:molybdate transport system ATP-binding protein